MEKKVSVFMVQPDLLWENPAGNLEMLEGMIGDMTGDPDLVILPETFATGFTMRAEQFAEQEDGPGVSWMRSLARHRDAFVTGSLIIKSGGAIFNRLYWISPDGVEGHYDKRHLFRMGGEERYFKRGEKREVFRMGPFRFMPQICYDIRFPVFARNRNDYDVLFYVANWPAPRQPVWEILLRARAIENQAYVLGVTRVGRDGEGVDHLGGSCAVDPMGHVEAALEERPGILNATVDLEKIREFREKFPVWKDADQFHIELNSCP
jgi:omega-amidase